MFTKTDFIVYGVDGLIDAIKQCYEIEDVVFDEAYDDLSRYMCDYYYEDFSESGRWDIGQAIIYKFENDDRYFRIWREVGLTEMQENYFYTQIPQVVHTCKVEREEWVM